MELFSLDVDYVIEAYFLTGRVTYSYALENLISLIDKLDIQRKFQNESFYKRLEHDFQDGCITPAITMAFINPVNMQQLPTIEVLRQQFEASIENGFILDGIQRLNTLRRIATVAGNNLDMNKHLYVNFIVCPSRDNLLYRMVTLNNGQKPMTARHQIEILSESIYDFNSYGFDIITEKEAALARPPKGFKKADLINAYISFLSDSTALDNKKIIEDKLDELVARKIIEKKVPNNSAGFNQILELISRMSESDILFDWLKNGNNLIGFVVALRTSFNVINVLHNNHLEQIISNYEKAFKNLNVSKIKLSRERRNLAQYFMINIDELREMDAIDLTLILADHI